MKTKTFIQTSSGALSWTVDRDISIRGVHMSMSSNASSGGDEHYTTSLIRGDTGAAPGAGLNDNVVMSLGIAADFQSAASYFPLMAAQASPPLELDIKEGETLTSRLTVVVGTPASLRSFVTIYYEVLRSAK